VDESVLREIASLVDPHLRPLIEVGPGKGSITSLVLPDAVIELDEGLAKALKWANPVLGDARKMPLRAVQIVSTLPYYITFDFFEEVIRLHSVRRLVLVLQKDFVDKIVSYPTYISYAINYAFGLIRGSVVPPSAFRPRPRVYSQVVVFNRKAVPSDRVLEFLKCISKYRNKSLSKAGELCGLEIREKRKVREFKPYQVFELLSVAELNSS